MKLRKIKVTDISDEILNDELEQLSAYERKKISAYTCVSRRNTLAGRMLLREMITENFGRNGYNISFNQNGKPLLDFCYFSISHSGEYAVCVLSNREVGVDIQLMSNFKQRKKYMLFSDLENKFINTSDNPETAYYTLWTMKEAYVKAKGGVLSDAAKTELVTSELKLKTHLPGFYFETCLFDGYVLTVCG